jgi:hypothetical protein
MSETRRPAASLRAFQAPASVRARSPSSRWRSVSSRSRSSWVVGVGHGTVADPHPVTPSAVATRRKDTARARRTGHIPAVTEPAACGWVLAEAGPAL